MVLYAFLVNDNSMELLTWMNKGVKPSPKRVGDFFAFTEQEIYKFSWEIIFWLHKDFDGPPVRGEVDFNGKRIPFQIYREPEVELPKHLNKSSNRTRSSRWRAGCKRFKPYHSMSKKQKLGLRNGL